MLEPESKKRWLAALQEGGGRAILQRFSPQYYYFSLHQVLAFAGLLRQIPPQDTDSLSLLGEVLYEELGKGNPDQVHSVLFRRFAAATGLERKQLALSREQALPGVVSYVEELERKFTQGPLEEGLSTYVFLESSAVETYPALLSAVRDLGFREEDLEFFAVHAVVEVEHERGARELLEKYCQTAEQLALVRRQTARMAELWTRFWDDIYEHTRG